MASAIRPTLATCFPRAIEDQIKRLEGVGSINVFGSGYAMRIWLDPFKLDKYQLTRLTSPARSKAQNTQVSVGSLGAVPAVEGQQINVTITAQSQLTTVGSDFAIDHLEDRQGWRDCSAERRGPHRNRPGKLWRRRPVRMAIRPPVSRSILRRAPTRSIRQRVSSRR